MTDFKPDPCGLRRARKRVQELQQEIDDFEEKKAREEELSEKKRVEGIEARILREEKYWKERGAEYERRKAESIKLYKKEQRVRDREENLRSDKKFLLILICVFIIYFLWP
jgi:hypothetical protein